MSINTKLVKLQLDAVHSLEVSVNRGVLNDRVVVLVLPDEILECLDALDVLLDGQKGGKIGRVRGDYDESKEPPSGGHQFSRQILGGGAPTLGCQGGQAEPERLLQGEYTLFPIVRVLFLAVLVAVGRPGVEDPNEDARHEKGAEYAEPHVPLEYVYESKRKIFLGINFPETFQPLDCKILNIKILNVRINRMF